MEVLFAKTETGIRLLHTCAEEQNTTGIWGHHPPRETWHTIIYRPDAFFQNQFGKHLYLLALNEMKTPQSKEKLGHTCNRTPTPWNMASWRHVAPPWLYIYIYMSMNIIPWLQYWTLFTTKWTLTTKHGTNILVSLSTEASWVLVLLGCLSCRSPLHWFQSNSQTCNLILAAWCEINTETASGWESN